MYVVVFRSVVRADANRDLLRWLDTAAHAEAITSGGLLEYVAGSDDGAKASVCVWASRDHADKASRLPMHQRAVAHAPGMYESWTITTYSDEDVQIHRRHGGEERLGG